MILFPAIDLKGGNCVRLLRGDMNEATIFSNSPGEQAVEFERAGCQWIHVVDLDGAVAGRSINVDAIESILDCVTRPIQVGGGIRDLEGIEYWLDRGVARVILGTAALKNPKLVKEGCRKFPGQVAVGIDARDGMVAVEGWVENSTIECSELARRFEDSGVVAIIYTDINRDGLLGGANIGSTVALASTTTIPVIASGGVSTIEDLKKLKNQSTENMIGVVCGRALYDKKIDLGEALKLLKTDKKKC